MSKQQELNLLLKRRFSPTADRAQPVFWIEEIRVYRQYSKDTLQCEYKLRPGLNILWADPGHGKKALYQRGVRGHAAGKTTFCRLLRYMLGEPTYGTKAFQQALINWEPNAIVVGKLWIDSKPWIVCRPLGLDKQEFAFPGENIEDVFSPPADVKKYSEFADELGDLVTQDLTAKDLPFGHELTWRYVMPWLSRDQECRLAHLLEWRDPITESHRPEMTDSDACYIMRSIMGLISKDEEGAQRKHRDLLNQRKDFDLRVPLLKHQADESLKRVRTWASDTALEDTLLFANIKHALKREAAAIAESPELVRAKERRVTAQLLVEERLHVANTQEDDLDRQKAMLETDRVELQALRGNVHRHEARAQMDDEASSPLGRCNVPLRVAEARGCYIARGKLIHFESHKNVDSAKAEVEAYKAVVHDNEVAVTAMEKAMAQARTTLGSARREHEAASTSYEALRADANRKCGVLEQQLDEVQATEAIGRQAEDAATELDRVKKEVNTSQRKQEELRKRADKKRTRVNELFEDIIQAVLGDDVNASFTAHANTIDLRVECHGERTSAATDTVKILCFDIAAMLLSSEGFGHHPRFLIHDSPREADLENAIYQLFFIYMEELEKTFDAHAPNFQYVLTTTEPPPEHLRKQPWLIAKLDASRAESRLLGVNL